MFGPNFSGNVGDEHYSRQGQRHFLGKNPVNLKDHHQRLAIWSQSRQFALIRPKSLWVVWRSRTWLGKNSEKMNVFLAFSGSKHLLNICLLNLLHHTSGLNAHGSLYIQGKWDPHQVSTLACSCVQRSAMSAEGRPLRESNDMDLAPSCHQKRTRWRLKHQGYSWLQDVSLVVSDNSAKKCSSIL